MTPRIPSAALLAALGLLVFVLPGNAQQLITNPAAEATAEPSRLVQYPSPLTSPQPAAEAGKGVRGTIVATRCCCYPPPSPQASYAAGVSLYLLKPFFEGNTAFVTTNATGTLQNTTAFTWDFEAAPAVWFGAVKDGQGWRVRYFHFDHQSDEARTTNSQPNFVRGPPSLTPPLPAPINITGFGSPGIVGTAGGTDHLTFISGAEINSFDVETTYQWVSGDLFLMLSGGGRYLRLEQNYSGLLTSRIPGSSETQHLNYHNQFNGGGPTAAVHGRWGMGNDGWSAFGMFRGALVVGASNRLTDFFQTVRDPGNNVGGSFQFASQAGSSSSHVLPVAELEVGAEYAQQVGNTRYLVRGAVVNQTYFDAGNASRQDGVLALFGVQLSLGLNY